MRLRYISILIACSASSAAQAQRLGGAAAPDLSLTRVFLSLFVCLVIAFLAILLLRKRYGLKGLNWSIRQRSQSRITVLETRRIGPQADVTLVRCDGEEFLLLLTPGGPAVLRQTLAQPEAVEE